MYQSVENKKIILSISPIWTGEDDIYDPGVKKIELGILVTNKSKEDFLVDEVVMGIRKNPFLPFLDEEFPIRGAGQWLMRNSEIRLTCDLKPVLNANGKQSRIYIKIKSGKTSLMSAPVSIKEMHSGMISIYARHF